MCVTILFNTLVRVVFHEKQRIRGLFDVTVVVSTYSLLYDSYVPVRVRIVYIFMVGRVDTLLYIS